MSARWDGCIRTCPRPARCVDPNGSTVPCAARRWQWENAGLRLIAARPRWPQHAHAVICEVQPCSPAGTRAQDACCVTNRPSSRLGTRRTLCVRGRTQRHVSWSGTGWSHRIKPVLGSLSVSATTLHGMGTSKAVFGLCRASRPGHYASAD